MASWVIQRLFVYGSLQPGGDNAHVLAGVAGDWAPATVRGRLLEAGWGAGIGYPGLLIDDDGEEVRGFVLTSTALDGEWDRLDKFEGSEYERVQSSVTLADGRQVTAFVYVVADTAQER